MSALDELIYDRTQTDVAYAAELNRKLGRGEALTAEELADWNAGLKGSYNANDFNRVDAAVRELGGMLEAAGYPASYFPPRRWSWPDQPHFPSELQSGAWLYASGEHDDMDDYVCTVNLIPVRPNLSITVRTDITISTGCGFCWYDASGSFINGTVGGARINWDGNFQDIVPSNAAYCKINICAEGVTPTAVGVFVVRQVDVGNDTQWFPEGMARVSYLATDGTQYIDTGYKPRGMHTHMWHTCYRLGGTGDYYALIGARNGGTQQYWLFYDQTVGSYGAFTARHGTTALAHSAESSSTLNRSLQPQLNKNVYEFYAQGESETLTAPATDFECPYTIYISAVNNSGQAQYISSAEIEWTEISEDDVLVRSLCPICDTSGHGVYYDEVSGVSFCDQHGGTFEADPATSGNWHPAHEMKLTWSMGDTITQREWEQYLANVQSLREAYYTMPDSPELPEPTAPLTYDGANAIERLIYDILAMYEGMLKRYRICGTFAAGNNYNRQYIRSV